MAHDPITVDSGQQRLPLGDAVPMLTVALVPAPDRIVVRLTGETDLSTASRRIEDDERQACRAGGIEYVLLVQAPPHRRA